MRGGSTWTFQRSRQRGGAPRPPGCRRRTPVARRGRRRRGEGSGTSQGGCRSQALGGQSTATPPAAVPREGRRRKKFRGGHRWRQPASLPPPFMGAPVREATATPCSRRRRHNARRMGARRRQELDNDNSQTKIDRRGSSPLSPSPPQPPFPTPGRQASYSNQGWPDCSPPAALFSGGRKGSWIPLDNVR